ncbi:MAG: cation-transporting P-type ATPase [Gemmatimonadota bacterium]
MSAGAPVVAWHTQEVGAVSEQLQVSVERGLDSADAAARLATDGPNVLAEAKPRSLAALIGHQFKSLVVALLVLAGGVALLMGDEIEAVAILVVIVLNAVIGFVTEWKASDAINALRRQFTPVALVRRDGREHQVPASTLVVGDVVLLAAGDRIAADGRIVEVARLRVDESALTGESSAATKSIEPVADADAPLGDRRDMVYMGTAITEGRGVSVVTATGARTEVGRIGSLIDEVVDTGTPLESKLAQLSRALLVVVLVLCVVIVVMGLWRGNALLPMIEVGTSLAIAAVPEGLLAVTTMTLAIGMQRMARMNALVRRLPAVESLGGTTVICTDKTGTLTRNEMTVQSLVVASRRVDVTGVGYAAVGGFEVDGAPLDVAASDAAGESLRLALRIGALCNDASLGGGAAGLTVLGDPTEGALIVAAAKAGLDHATLKRDYPRLTEVPFDSVVKRMVTVHRTPGGQVVAYVKGSPAALLHASTTIVTPEGTVELTPARNRAVRDTNEVLAGEALRVLGLAYRELAPGYTQDDLTSSLTFLGCVAMIDPLRAEAKATIATCRAAGIRTVMITGDQQVTAAEIARQLGIDVDLEGRPLRTVHARELAGLDEEGWNAAVTGAAVFARVSPEHKLRIVGALQRQGAIVAMTGDGVNDAPALRQADIGIAMGIRGTEVAKEAADMIITDDNFATIVRAVEQGRIIVQNILRFIHYLFSCNFSEILVVFTSIMLGWPLPLSVLQILWLNLVTDIFPAMALALEPSAADVMQRPPRDPAAPLMTPGFGWLIVWQGALMAACTLLAFGAGLRGHGHEGEGLRQAVTIAFMTLALAEVLHAFNVRSRTRSIFSAETLTNGWLWGATLLCVALQLAAVEIPGLRRVLGTAPLTLEDWGVIVAAAVAPVAVVELVKWGQRWRAAVPPESAPHMRRAI